MIEEERHLTVWFFFGFSLALATVILPEFEVQKT